MQITTTSATHYLADMTADEVAAAIQTAADHIHARAQNTGLSDRMADRLFDQSVAAAFAAKTLRKGYVELTSDALADLFVAAARAYNQQGASDNSDTDDRDAYALARKCNDAADIVWD